MQEYHTTGLSNAVLSAWSDAARYLEVHGAEIIPITLAHTSASLPAYYIIAAAEAYSNLAKYDGLRYGMRQEGAFEQSYLDTRVEGFGDEVKRRLLLGSFVLQSTYIVLT